MKTNLLRAALAALTITVQAMESQVRGPAEQEQHDLDRAIALLLQDQHNDAPQVQNHPEDDLQSALALSAQEYEAETASREAREREEAQLQALNEQFIMAIEEGASKDEVQALLDQGANVNYKNELGSTPLHVASVFGSVEVCEFFLDLGAELHAQDVFGFVPVRKAAMRGCVMFSNILLAKVV